MGQLPKQPKESKFKSLPARVLTALVLAGVALGSYLGGFLTFSLFYLVLLSFLLFELCGLQSPAFSRSRKIAYVLSGCVFIAGAMVFELANAYSIDLDKPRNNSLLFVFVLIFVIVSGVLLRYKIYMVACGTGIFLAVLGHSMAFLEGKPIFLLIVLLIIGTDAGGYFAGKLIGGPKFFPRVSPNKTWSGTIGGWALSIIILIGFMYFWRDNLPTTYLVFYALAISVFSQLGDLSISAIKRKVGVKDSSNLLPGHGGFLDRFDGFIGAGVLIFFLTIMNFQPNIFDF
ncbi:MAG: phosphatidate cytidylyltransferase [Paracoccaceae bacterium]|nr:phosphatidate cytidylyltransferase [Paracoccaceae bacterium]MDE2915874.1 phosphatidate cytidylyltransferase [Paracoccaceae bacterium]